MEVELEEERRQRSQALSGKKKLESELLEMDSKIDGANKNRDEALKQLKKLQVKRRTSNSAIHEPASYSEINMNGTKI